jgi:hypothetical protein
MPNHYNISERLLTISQSRVSNVDSFDLVERVGGMFSRLATVLSFAQVSTIKLSKVPGVCDTPIL